MRWLVFDHRLDVLHQRMQLGRNRCERFTYEQLEGLRGSELGAVLAGVTRDIAEASDLALRHPDLIQADL